MAVSDDLFKLVKSMSSAEKAFFLRYAAMYSAGKKSSYRRLFNAVDYQVKRKDIYDEEALKEKLDIKTKKHLPVIKNNLYKLILRALNTYHAEDKPETKLREYIENYNILHSKTMYDQCDSILRKAKKTARDNEIYYDLLYLLRMERTLKRDSQSIEEFDKTSNEIFNEEQEIIGKLQNLSKFDNLTTRAMQIVKKHLLDIPRDNPAFAEVENILNEPLLNDEKLALTYNTKIHFYSVRSSLLWKIDRNEEGYNSSHKLVEFIESDFDKLRGRYNQYTIALNNLLTYQTALAKYNEAMVTLGKLRNLENKFKGKLTEANKFKIFIFSSIEGITLARATGDEKTAHEFVGYIKNGFKKYSGKIVPYHRILICFNVSMFYFMAAEDYTEALKWISKVLNLPKIDVGFDMQCASRILNLLIQFELNNTDTLEHLIKSTQNFIGKREFFKFEILTVDFFRKLLKLKSAGEADFYYRKMKKDITKLLEDPDEKSIIENLEMIYWIESKIQKKSIMKIKSVSKVS